MNYRSPSPLSCFCQGISHGTEQRQHGREESPTEWGCKELSVECWGNVDLNHIHMTHSMNLLSDLFSDPHWFKCGHGILNSSFITSPFSMCESPDSHTAWYFTDFLTVIAKRKDPALQFCFYDPFPKLQNPKSNGYTRGSRSQWRTQYQLSLTLVLCISMETRRQSSWKQMCLKDSQKIISILEPSKLLITLFHF